MPDLRTAATEIGTALGMLGYKSFVEAVNRRPSELINVSSAYFDQLVQIVPSHPYYRIATTAFANGESFLHSAEGLRERIPARIEWKGPARPPGYEMLPADLRVDHVYLISCKYQSKVLMNSSPSNLFDNLLNSRSPTIGDDWYALTAPDEYEHLYGEVRKYLKDQIPSSISLLSNADREIIKNQLPRKWPSELQAPYDTFCEVVSNITTARWSASLTSRRVEETLLWRMLRLSESPYFILGADANRTIRVRIATPWDWRQLFRIEDFRVWSQQSGQPRVEWEATVALTNMPKTQTVRGHVEIRWSHGRFCGRPEAKIYLDTAHDQVPGYFSLTCQSDSLFS